MIIKFSFIFVHVNKQDFQWLVNLIVVAGFCKYIFLRLSISTLNFEHFNSEIMHGIIWLICICIFSSMCWSNMLLYFEYEFDHDSNIFEWALQYTIKFCHVIILVEIILLNDSRDEVISHWIFLSSELRQCFAQSC